MTDTNALIQAFTAGMFLGAALMFCGAWIALHLAFRNKR